MKPPQYVRHHLVEITSCIGKVAFASYDQAKAIVERGKRGPNSQHRGVYRCPVCEKWHVGRRGPTSKVKRRLTERQMQEEDAMLNEAEDQE